MITKGKNKNAAEKEPEPEVSEAAKAAVKELYLLFGKQGHVDHADYIWLFAPGTSEEKQALAAPAQTAKEGA